MRKKHLLILILAVECINLSESDVLSTKSKGGKIGNYDNKTRKDSQIEKPTSIVPATIITDTTSNLIDEKKFDMKYQDTNNLDNNLPELSKKIKDKVTREKTKNENIFKHETISEMHKTETEHSTEETSLTDFDKEDFIFTQPMPNDVSPIPIEKLISKDLEKEQCEELTPPTIASFKTTNFSITIGWNITSYINNPNCTLSLKIFCSTSNDSELQINKIIVTSNVVQNMFENLLSNTNYTCYSVLNSTNKSAYSSNSTILTSLEEPKIIEISSTNRNITIKWEVKSFQIEDENQLTLNVSYTMSFRNGTSLTKYNAINVNNTDPEIILTDLYPLTNYTCKGTLYDMKNGSTGSEEKIISTLDELPGPVNVEIDKPSESSFTISWEKPFEEPGSFKVYHIIIESSEPEHYVREECKFNSNTTIDISEFDNNTVTFYDAKPDYNYNVTVFVENGLGNGSRSVANILTKSTTSENPLNLAINLTTLSNNCDKEGYNSSMHITWELPCNTNGILQNFAIIIVGIYVEGDEEDAHHDFVYKTSISPNKEIENIYYNLTVPNLQASFKYSVVVMPVTVENIEGTNATKKIKTPDGCVNRPESLTFSNITSSSFEVSWRNPSKYYGKIDQYRVNISQLSPIHLISKDKECSKSIYDRKDYIFKGDMNELTFNKGLPHFEYLVSVNAITSAGNGQVVEKKLVTLSIEPDSIRNLNIDISQPGKDDTYDATALVRFDEPCNTNGPFKNYQLVIKRYRDGDYYNETTDLTEISLKPDFYYELSVVVVTENSTSKPTETHFFSPAGVPIQTEVKTPVSQNADTITIELSKKLFGTDNGKLLYYQLVLIEPKDTTNFSSSYGYWNANNWPKVDLMKPYENTYNLTKPFWNPFSDNSDVVQFYITVRQETCKAPSDCLHLELKEDIDYVLLVRGLTQNAFRDEYISFKTNYIPTNLGLILGLIIGFLLLVILGGGLFIMWKKRQLLSTLNFIFRQNNNIPETEDAPWLCISIKHYISYYEKTVSNPLILKNQYEQLEKDTKEYKESIAEINFAVKPENKRKNRYTNILPYDHSRVKLNIDEDDEICSDYINASYIKGFSGKIEYIAAQGPLESTCRDFWKMVIQENVTMIVMVTQFVESNKTKCHKYFPNNHESLYISEDIEVRCSTELHFGTYFVRTLVVQKDIIERTVVHLQFIEWPDFGCPSSTDHMLNFCQIVRERQNKEQGLVIIHCSAGVGRTGSLIALDILLQTIKRHKTLSIYETVWELRQQRTNMVQNETQYVFLHACIKDVLENPKIYLTEGCDDDYRKFYKKITSDSPTQKPLLDKESVF